MPFVVYGVVSAQSCIQVQSNYKFTNKQIENAKNIYTEGMFVAKRGKYEALRVGMFDSFSDAKAYMEKNKTIFKNSVIIDGCSNDENLPLLTLKKSLQKIDSEPSIIKPDKNVVTEETIEENLLSYLFKQKPEDKDIYDHYSYSNYFSRLLKEDENVENSYYDNEIVKIDQLIREDRYNSNIYLSAESRITREHIDATSTKNHNTRVDLNWEYRLYDGQKSYIYDQIKKIYEQGSQIQYEDSKNILAIRGADLYGNLLFSQTILEVYKNLYESQENLFDVIFQNRKNGLATVIDEIDAKYDLVELEKRLLNFEIIHSRNTYLLKQSLNSKSDKPIFLSPLNISKMNHSEEEEKMLILHNNPSIAIAQNELKRDKTLILNESARRMPKVDLDASTGYSWSEDLINNVDSNGTNWDAGITVNIPIYERNDIYLNEQRAKVVALQAKNRLKLATKEALNLWDNHKKVSQQLDRLNTMLKNQLSGQKEKLKIIREQYLQGKAEYRDYADALDKISVVSVDLINNIISVEKQKIYGNYLLGKKIYNVKN